ncbi:hypothetical protein BFP72_12125 [Reichenbachiella sp. 5M10]|uniref:translocation/assembly module TamB domain-containing protein n=1 Tax=Reichenbachiella sp. 5M10 TaxID=1889772 RepID=UPI000C160F32|nr:translocation/assembly module TamB domain-containing protein [Reichenbachiella sp. 5M10]PIB36087.1 hypothetical protein BFP72_12125 [Reichenbachiella sp. 5M10]
MSIGRKYKIIRALGGCLLGIFILFVGMILLIRSAWGQDLIVGKVLDFVSEKTETRVSLDRLFITFSGHVYVEGLYVEDQVQDTLLYSQDLEVSMALLPILLDRTVDVDKVKWSGLTARVSRPESGPYNFDFLKEAFASEDTVVEESTNRPYQFEVGRVYFQDFDLRYDDRSSGMYGALQLGSLTLDVDHMDIENLVFDVAELMIAEADLVYQITKLSRKEEEAKATSASQLPTFAVRDLELSDVTVRYTSVPDSMKLGATIGGLLLRGPQLNLREQIVAGELFQLEDSEVIYHSTSKAHAVDTANTAGEESGDFVWPDWRVIVKEVAMDRNRFAYLSDTARSQPGVFNAQGVDLQEVELKATEVQFMPGRTTLQLTQLGLKDRSGFDLEKLAFGLAIDEREMILSDLVLKTEHNALRADLEVRYPSIAALMEDPKVAAGHLQLSGLSLAVSEAFIFAPALAEEDYLQALSQKKITGNIDLSASDKGLTLRRTRLNWGELTQMTLDGTVRHPWDSSQLTYDVRSLDLTTQRTDLSALLGSSAVRYPRSMQLTGAVVGNLDEAELTALVHSTDGQVSLRGMFAQRETFRFDAELEVRQVEMGRLMQNPELGQMSFTAQAQGSGDDLASLNAVLKTNFTALELKGRDYSDLRLEGKMSDGIAQVELEVADEHIQMTMNGQLKIAEERKEVEAYVDLEGADFYALGLTQDDVRARMKLKVMAVLDATDMMLDASISDGLVVHELESYPLGEFVIQAQLTDDSTKLNVQSQVLQGNLQSNARPEDWIGAVQRHLANYMGEDRDTTGEQGKVALTLDLRVEETPMLLKVLLTDLEELDPVEMHLSFSEDLQQLDAQFSVPYAHYQEISIDSLEWELHSDQRGLDFRLGWREIAMSPLLIDRTQLVGHTVDGRLLLELNAYTEDELLMHIGSELTRNGDTVSYHMNPDGLLVNQQVWSVHPDNAILMGNGFVDFSNFILTQDQQQVELTCGFADVEEEHVGVRLDGFKLSSISSYLSGGEETLAQGLMSGDVVLVNPFADKAMLADLRIDRLQFLGAALGVLTLQGESKTAKNYDFALALKGDSVDVGLVGDYHATNQGPEMNLALEIREFQAGLLTQLSGGTLTDASGVITGEARFRGTAQAPDYRGDLRFDQVSVRVDALDARFELEHEYIDFDTERINLNRLTLLDEKKNAIQLSGFVRTEDLTNPQFDLRIQAKDFHALSSEEGDHDLFYGRVNLDAALTVKGDLKVPVVRGEIHVNEGTDLTVIVPESEVEVKERDGVVLFVNKSDPDDILTRGGGEEQGGVTVKGYDVNATVTINEKSSFKIVVNEQTNDNLEISGRGDFNLSLSPNGRTSFTGRYEINDGRYKASLYNLVTKEFEMAPGSRIVWKGNPLDAEVDIRAIYKVTTSAAPLMANKISGMSTESASIYNRRLPFLVYLNVQDELLKPRISFALDMPKDEQSALGGEVYGQVKQLNEQEEELNKQVFSLLVLDRFFPASGSDGSSGGSAAIARENVSKVLSSQLNQFSDKVTGDSGLELEFNVDSYSYNQGNGTESRTALGIDAQKKFADDRVIVKVGGDVNIQGKEQEGQGSPLIGDASVEYLLTEDGVYRIKGFGKDEFDTVIDGQYYVTGIAFIYNREFNEFSDLWKKQAEKEGIDLENREQDEAGTQEKSKGKDATSKTKTKKKK